MKPNYDRDYFIAKFSAISEEKFITNRFVGADHSFRCVLGFCGPDLWWRGWSRLFDDLPEEARALAAVLGVSNVEMIEDINNGTAPFRPEESPKQRILAALRAVAPAVLVA